MIAPDYPEGPIRYLIGSSLLISGVSFLFGIISSILAIKNKELGVKKYVGIFTPLLVILYVILVPILIGLVGFKDP